MRETDLFALAIEEAKKFKMDNQPLTEMGRAIFTRAWVRGYYKSQEHAARNKMGLDLK
jgi:hypothetical protein